MEDIGNVGNIRFGFLSPEEIIGMSVCEVNKNSLSGKNSVYAKEMGCITGINEKCPTCGLDKDCWGHFGYIKLNEPVIHPLCHKTITSFLKCFCKKCYKLLILKEQLELNNLIGLTGKKRFTHILEKLEKTDICPHCNSPQPKIMYKPKDSVISMEYKQKKNAGNPKFNIVLNVEDIKTILDNISDEDVKTLGLDPKEIHPKNLIFTVLPVIPPCSRPYVMADGNTCDDDLTYQLTEIVKLNNQLSDNAENKKKPATEQKRQHVINSLKFRISTMFNNTKGKAKHPTDSRPIKCVKVRLTGKEGRLRGHIMGKRVDFSARTVIGSEPTLGLGYVGVPKEVATTHTFPEYANTINIDFLQRLVDEGKANFIIKKDRNGGQIRVNLKYALYKKPTEVKQGDIIVRGDVKLEEKDGKIIIPKSFEYTIKKDGKYDLKKGDKILRKEKVIEVDKAKKYDLKKSDKILPNIRVFYIGFESFTLCEGDILVRNGEIIPVELASKRKIIVELGDIVERHLRKGDPVLLNRQPTLWKGSMMTHKIEIHDTAKTFRFNLMSCPSFNADFDGDEMNIHTAQSYLTRTNTRLANVATNMISAQNSQPNIVIVQDALLASFLMTRTEFKLSKEQFKEIFKGIVDHEGKEILKKERVEKIRKILEKFDKPPCILNGKGIFSLLLPGNFFYENTNNANPDEPTVKIYSGVLLEGALNKDVIGKGSNSFLILLNKEYGIDVASNFINNVYFIANRWLMIHGFSIGISDCMISSKKSVEDIKEVLTKCYAKAEAIELNTQNPVVKEVRITAELNQAKDVGLKLAKEAMKSTNNFLATITSKAKGDFFNITQITGIGGQQNISNERIAKSLNHKRRTLPHYPFDRLPKEREYESRGFIDNSFIKGFTPTQFYFHAMSGREGVCDTAMGTAKSGYIQRKIVKAAEDIIVRQDGTVRDAQNKIYQYYYGTNGFNPQKTLKIKGVSYSTNISRLANRLNYDYEEKNIPKISAEKKCLIMEIRTMDYDVEISEKMDIETLRKIRDKTVKKFKEKLTKKDEKEERDEKEEESLEEDEEKEEDEESESEEEEEVEGEKDDSLDDLGNIGDMNDMEDIGDVGVGELDDDDEDCCSFSED